MPTLRTFRRAACTILLLAAVPAAAFECPERGGRPWREIGAGHVTLVTDLGSGAGQDLARELERLILVLHAVLPKVGGPVQPVRAVALRDGEDFDLFAPKHADALYVRDELGVPTVVMPGVLGGAQREVIAHELTHHLAARVFARQPLWFSEGVATFMETIGASGPGNTPTLGGVPLSRFREVYPFHGGAAKVLQAQGHLETSRDYALAWALVHFLFNQRSAELARLQAAFAQGKDPAAAWREIFPEWDPASATGAAALDEAVGRYLANGKFRYFDVHLPAEQPVTERPLSAAEVHSVRMSLPWINRGEKVAPERRAAEVAEALAHDPGHVKALRSSKGERLPLAERAAAAHPEDVDAWLFLAAALPPGAGERREEALRKAVAAGPANAIALNNLAWLLLETGRSGEALPLARSAVGLAPWSSAALDTLAQVSDDLGLCAQALQVERRAVDVLPERLPAKERAAYLETLGHLEAKCGVKASAPPATAPAETAAPRPTP